MVWAWSKVMKFFNTTTESCEEEVCVFTINLPQINLMMIHVRGVSYFQKKGNGRQKNLHFFGH